MSRPTHQLGGALIYKNMIKICKTCGKEFKTYPSLVKRGWGKYCSHHCSKKVTGYQKGNKIWLGRKHTKKTKRKMSISAKTSPLCPRGDKVWNWKGGRMKRKNRWLLLRPNHPNAWQTGYVYQYRLVAELCLNRYLTSQEIIHHINEHTLDDRPENLYLFPSKAEHTYFHNLKNKPILKSNLI